MSNIWAHDMAERMKIRRKVIARDGGLGDMDVGTFPSEGATHTVIDRGSNPLTGMLLAGLLSAGVGGLGTYAMLGDKSVTSGVNSVINPPKESELTLGPIELEIEVVGEEGGVVIESVRPAAP